MKQLFAVLALSVLLCSCSKSNDDEDDSGGGPPPSRTAVNFTNKLAQPLTNMLIGSWNGTAPAKLIKNVGTLAIDASTGEVLLTDKTLINVYVYADFSGQSYMTPYGFGIGQGITNNWQINGSVIWDRVNKTSDLYP